MQTRLATSLFGSLGMEMNPTELDENDKKLLKSGLKFYKAHRDLIHNGDYYRYDTDGESD